MSTSPTPRSEFKSKNGITRLRGAYRYSIEGLKFAWTNEYAFRQELMIVVPAVCIAIVLPVSTVERIMLISALAGVLIVELLNSAIEAVVDRISLEWHHGSKNAKDLGSAAVLVTIVLAVLVWGVIVLPLIFA